MHQTLFHPIEQQDSFMPYHFTISPDFPPGYLAGWYIFNTWLQKQTNCAIRLEIFNSFLEQRAAINNDKIDLIYSNPFDAAMLVREKGFQPIVKPVNNSDEAIIAVKNNSSIKDIAQLQAGIKIAVTDDPDVQMMGMIMLEPADIDPSNSQFIPSNTYIIVAKHLLKSEADVGIFFAEAYDNLSNIVKNQLRILVRSQISIIHHSLMIGPNFLDHRQDIQNILISMHNNEKGKKVLDNFKFKAWQIIDDEEMEFMIDLMDTLKT